MYCLVSIPFYWAVARLGLLVMAATDALLLISFIVVAVCIGKPVSYLNCYAADPSSAAVNTASAYAFTASFMANWAKDGTNLAGWAGLTKNNCLETKAIWGFSIALW